MHWATECANLKVHNDSWACSSRGLRLQIIKALLFCSLLKEGCNSLVSLESRKGTCFDLLAKDDTTFPSVDRLLLIFWASFKEVPDVPLLLTRSLPAKSIKCKRPSRLSPEVLCVTATNKQQIIFAATNCFPQGLLLTVYFECKNWMTSRWFFIASCGWGSPTLGCYAYKLPNLRQRTYLILGETWYGNFTAFIDFHV